MELKNNPIYKKISEKEQHYNYLRLLFEDLESSKYQINELQKMLRVANNRILELENKLTK